VRKIEPSESGILAIRAVGCKQSSMAKKELTLREHLSTIQSEGGKARWVNLSPAERSAQARKAVEARWAKKRAADAASEAVSSEPKSVQKAKSKSKLASKKSARRKA
jgi:hypothetical protein